MISRKKFVFISNKESARIKKLEVEIPEVRRQNLNFPHHWFCFYFPLVEQLGRYVSKILRQQKFICSSLKSVELFVVSVFLAVKGNKSL